MNSINSNSNSNIRSQLMSSSKLKTTHLVLEMKHIFTSCFPNVSFELENKQWILIGKRHSSQLLGFASYVLDQDHSILTLWDLCTHPMFQNQGIASYLLDQLTVYFPKYDIKIYILVQNQSISEKEDPQYKQRLQFYTKRHFHPIQQKQFQSYLTLEMVKYSETEK